MGIVKQINGTHLGFQKFLVRADKEAKLSDRKGKCLSWFETSKEQETKKRNKCLIFRLIEKWQKVNGRVPQTSVSGPLYLISDVEKGIVSVVARSVDNKKLFMEVCV